MHPLDFMAAVVPSIAALGVAGDLLLEHRNRTKEMAFRYQLNAELDAQDFPPTPEGFRLKTEAYQRVLLENGYDRPLVTFRDDQVLTEMGSAPFSTREQVRQWVLIVGGLAGIVLLAWARSFD